MKFLSMLALVVAAGLPLGAAENSAVSFADHGKVSAALAKSSPLVSREDLHLLVSGSHRDKNGGVEVHDHETDVIYIVSGEATFVTGGKMINGKSTKAGQWLGTNIEGGESRHLVPGDVVVVPAGVPHWFKEVPSQVSYYVVKVLK
jgi:quercetin dioxygenase-like cupin family protein